MPRSALSAARGFAAGAGSPLRRPRRAVAAALRSPSSARRDLQADEIGPDRDHVADLGAQPDDLAIHRRGDFDRRLVGHHGGEDRVLAHQVADLDVPLDEFGFGDAFADIGQPDHMLGHLTASMVSSSARPTRAGPGK